MQDNDLEKIKERLQWYIYDSYYWEYNDQEVNFLIEKLQSEDPAGEDEILSSYSSIKQKPKKDRIRSKKMIVTASISAITVAASFFIMLSSSNESIAGLKIGIFNFIKRDENGIQMIVSPEKNEEETIKTYMSPDIPDNIMEKIWIPPNDLLDGYQLSKVVVYRSSEIEVHFNSRNNSSNVIFRYDTDRPSDNFVFYYLFYSDISIAYSKLDTNSYMFSFEYGSTFYSMESNVDKDSEALLYGFIDYILNR